jgi:hypothetical protein
MDEDISLIGFNYTVHSKFWNCAFYPDPSPLIVQPIIAESNQFFNFVNYNTWQSVNNKKILATASGT